MNSKSNSISSWIDYRQKRERERERQEKSDRRSKKRTQRFIDRRFLVQDFYLLQMLSLGLLYFVFGIISSTFCAQSKIHIGIVDSNVNLTRIINIDVPNVAFCTDKIFSFQLYWINTMKILPNFFEQLQSDYKTIHVFLTYTNDFYTKLIQDYAQINQIPFVDIKSSDNQLNLCSLTKLFDQEYYFRPNILQVLINYIKFSRIKKAIYIYNNDESTNRIYDLLKFFNIDEYFNRFSLDIRSIHHHDIYSLLYHIDSYSFEKNDRSRLILLDLYSYEDYKDLFEKISHMGLTGDSYQYIILSTFDVCSWMIKLNFAGQLIYFDDQQRDCLSESVIPTKSVKTKTVPYRSYYRSTLTFRSPSNFSIISNSLNNTDRSLKSCHSQLLKNVEYFSYEHFHSQLSNVSLPYSYSLYKTLNLLIQMFSSNVINCKTYRLKAKAKSLSNDCHLVDADIYSTKKYYFRENQRGNCLIGRYTSTTNQYRSCQINQTNPSQTRKQILQSKTYYITSLFDEPFLMLRKRTKLHEKYSQLDMDLKELRGQILDFDEVEGFCVDLAERVCSILNITCRFRIVEDGGFGSENSSTGIWNGLYTHLFCLNKVCFFEN